ncbi:MAG: hypothetical protein JJU33_01430 [Phycisphaerales bacterium]|nr:hypothetical protein [Phycisphaerales bacterium]
MSVTTKLLRLYRVDQQITGLQSRLKAAQRFLDEQERQIGGLETKRNAIDAQVRQLSATAGNLENDANSIQVRIDTLRELMNNAKTNKEYQALLVEVNTLKADKGKIDEQAIGYLEQIEKLQAELADLDSQKSDREKVKGVAATDRDQRADEIRDRLEELKKQREHLVKEVPADALAIYQDRTIRFGDDEDGVMAPIHTHDFRRHEFVCGSCMMGIPFESVLAILKEKLTPCTSCGVIMFVEEDLAEKLTTKAK